MQNKKIIRLAIAAMLTALSVVSLYAIRLPLIPSAPFLEYDAADIPVLIGSMLLGPGMGLLMLLAVCAIQAFTVSAASGWIGFVMHLAASGVLVLIASMIYKKKTELQAADSRPCARLARHDGGHGASEHSIHGHIPRPGRKGGGGAADTRNNPL